jgi:hypothetical protein
MKFNKSGAPVTKLSSFYIIGNTKGATECYLTGQRGSYDSDYFVSNRSFKVPTGVTVNFYQPDGYILGFGTAALRNGTPKKHGGTNDQSYSGGGDCTNYILTKDQGPRRTATRITPTSGSWTTPAHSWSPRNSALCW